MKEINNRSFTYVSNLLNAEKGSRFRQNFIAVVKANALAQALSIAIAPLLTRLYTPADFGAVALFSSILSLLLAFSTWRFEWSVPNTKSRLQATSLIVLGACVLLLVCTLIFLFLLIFDMRWNLWKGLEVLEPFLFLIPIALIGAGTHQLLQSWYIREAKLSSVANSKIIQSLGVNGINILGGFAKLGPLGLICGMVASVWLGIGMLFQNAEGMKPSLTKLSLKRIRRDFLKFWKEATLSTGVAIANSVSITATPILFARYYSSTEIGWYALMYRLAITPVRLFTNAIGQSFWSEASVLIKRDRSSLKKLYIKTTKRLTIASIPIILVCLAGPLFIGKLFGEEEWGQAGNLLAAISPLLLGQIIVSPLSHLVIHEKQHWQFIWDCIRLLLVSISIIIGTQMTNNITYTTTLMSLSMLIMYIVLFFLNLKCLES